MTRYRMNDATMALPPLSYVDLSTQSLETLLPDETDLVLRVHRMPRLSATTLAQHCESELERARRRLRGFELVSSEQRFLGPEEAIEVVSRWQGSTGVVYTHQVHLFAVKHPTFLLVACNASWPSRAQAAHCMETVAQRFRFGWDDSTNDTIYRADDLSFEVPNAPFIDRTHNHLHFGGDSGNGVPASRAAGLDIHVERRDPVADEKRPLAEVVDAHLDRKSVV